MSYVLFSFSMQKFTLHMYIPILAFNFWGAAMLYAGSKQIMIKMLDRVLSLIDGSKEESVAVIATMIDWSKAFPRLDSTLGIESFIENGVRPSLIPIVASFLWIEGWRWNGMDVCPRKGGCLLEVLRGVQYWYFGISLSIKWQFWLCSCKWPLQIYGWFNNLEAVYLMNFGIATYTQRAADPTADGVLTITPKNRKCVCLESIESKKIGLEILSF